MVGTPEEEREHIALLVGSLDVARLSPDDAARFAELFAEIVRLGDAGKALCAARGAESDLWREAGDRSAAHWVARISGSSVSRGKAVLDTGRACGEHASLGEVLTRGGLSIDAGAEIASVAECAPDQVDRLIGVAEQGSLAELRTETRRVRMRAKGRRECEGRDRARRNRSVRRHADGNGGARLVLSSSVEDIAFLEASVEPHRDAAFARARQCGGEREPVEAIAYDAYELALRAGSSAAAAHAHAGSAGRAGVASAASPTDESPQGTLLDDASEANTGSGPDDGAGPDAASASDDASAPDGGAGPDAGGLGLPKSAPEMTWIVDHTALRRGHATMGERCELAGHGPVPVASVADALEAGASIAVAAVDEIGLVVRVARLARPPGTSAESRWRNHDPTEPPPWWIDTEVIIILSAGDLPEDPSAGDRYQRALIERGVDVAELIHHGRQPTAAQKTALKLRDPTCRVAGCATAARLEIDHHIDWSKSRYTTLAELGRLCSFHHGLRTFHGYELQPGPGKRRLLPPQGDP